MPEPAMLPMCRPILPSRRGRDHGSRSLARPANRVELPMAASTDTPPRIVFLDRATLSPETTLRPPSFAHHWESHERTTQDDVASRIAGADIVVTNKAP